MEKRINTKITSNIVDFKNGLREIITDKIERHKNTDSRVDFEEILQYAFDFKGCEISKEDLTKRKRTKNVVPHSDRCCAYRANNEQCSRRKKDENQFCGTHIKGTPHGIINESIPPSTTEKISLTVQEIKGIHYYIDDNFNVYKHEDILQNKSNPSIIAKCVKSGDNYSMLEIGV
jgi:hypothetical protein